MSIFSEKKKVQSGIRNSVLCLISFIAFPSELLPAHLQQISRHVWSDPIRRSRAGDSIACPRCFQHLYIIVLIAHRNTFLRADMKISKKCLKSGPLFTLGGMKSIHYIPGSNSSDFRGKQVSQVVQIVQDDLVAVNQIADRDFNKGPFVFEISSTISVVFPITLQIWFTNAGLRFSITEVSSLERRMSKFGVFLISAIMR